MRITRDNIDKITETEKCSVDTMIYKGYELIDELFIDTSGFGAEDEPALTYNQLIDKINEWLKLQPVIYTAFTNSGQFQAYMGIFVKNKKNHNVERINANTLKIKDGNKTIYRLYDTNILTVYPDKLVLNSGGYQSKLTKDRLNSLLAEISNYYIEQKNYEWTVKSHLEDTAYKFIDGLTITL